jgi:hypothetical protein
MTANPIDTRVVGYARPRENAPQATAAPAAMSAQERYFEALTRRIEGSGSRDRDSAITDALHSKKLPYPKFDGAYRKYPRFKRDWENYLTHNLVNAGEPTVVKCFLDNCVPKSMLERLDPKETM